MNFIRSLFLAGVVFTFFLSQNTTAAVQVPAYEGSLKVQFELRENIHNHDEIPFDNYLKLDLKDLPGNSTLRFYGKMWKDLGYGGDWNGDLYQLYIKIPNKTQRITAGRQFISEGFETHTADALKYSNTLQNGIIYTIYFGKPRDFEPNSPSGNDFLWGTKINYKNAYIGYENLHDDGSVKKSAFAFGFHRRISKTFSLYHRTELDARTGNIVESTLGSEIIPIGKLRINLETEYYYPAFTYTQTEYLDPIFMLFSEGRQLRLTESIFYDISDKWQIFQSYTYSDIQRQNNDSGHLLKTGFVRDTWTENGWRIFGSINCINSWLGRLRGIEAGFNKWLDRHISLQGSADIGRYYKKLYGKHWANAFFLSAKYTTDTLGNLEIGIENRNNEDFERDTRVMLRFYYLFYGQKAYKKEETK